MYNRFHVAVEDIAQEVIRFELLPEVERQAVADRLLMMTWLITDPDASTRKHITLFQQAGWGIDVERGAALRSDEAQPLSLDDLLDRHILHHEIMEDRAEWVDWVRQAWVSVVDRASVEQTATAAKSRGKGNTKKKGGRPRITNQAEVRKRQDFELGWKDAKGGGRSFDQYCEDEEVSKQEGRKYLQWCRDNRSADNP